MTLILIPIEILILIRPLQAALRARGVEVVCFDQLTPSAVADYCGQRGYLQILWECGGHLAAAAAAEGVFHKARALQRRRGLGFGAAPNPGRKP